MYIWSSTIKHSLTQTFLCWIERCPGQGPVPVVRCAGGFDAAWTSFVSTWVRGHYSCVCHPVHSSILPLLLQVPSNFFHNYTACRRAYLLLLSVTHFCYYYFFLVWIHSRLNLVKNYTTSCFQIFWSSASFTPGKLYHIQPLASVNIISLGG